MSFVPYHIHHLNLANGEYSPEWSATCGHYVVVWWGSVPLGEQYFNPGSLWTQAEPRIARAVAHTLQQYAGLENKTISVGCASLMECAELAKSVLVEYDRNLFPEICPVSVVVCTRDRASYLRTCLAYLLQQQCKPAEIIVVDNASQTDETRSVAQSFPGVTYVREDRPGLDIARNTGARYASHGVIAYTDDDTLPDPLWVYRVYESFKKTSVAAMTGLVLAAELRTEAQLIFERHWPFNRGYIDKYYDTPFFMSRLASGVPAWDIGAGANMAFRKEVFERIGYFDERLDVGAAGCSGDSEFWYRILAHGYTIHYNPRAVVHHVHRETIDGLKKQLYAYMRGFAAAILVQYQRFKNPGDLKHLFLHVPRYYLHRIIRGFPRYTFRNRTLWHELRGLFAGILYFWKHRHTNPNSIAHGKS
jgi:glycosyltransferase involved in cell wall biosynthesis